MTPPRWLAIAHSLPGRTRLRSPVLRKDQATCERLADALAAAPGVLEVRVRPYTGSALVLHERELTAAALASEAARVLDCAHVVEPGQQPPDAGEVPAFSTIARKVASAVNEIDRDIRRATSGSFDLGTLATLGFFTAGAVEVVRTRQLPMPPWFNLAWWGFRTFVTTEAAEIEVEGG